MSGVKKEELLLELKKEILRAVLDSDGDYDKMNVNSIISLCHKLQQSDNTEVVHPLDTLASLSLDEFEVAQNSIYARMNSLRM